MATAMIDASDKVIAKPSIHHRRGRRSAEVNSEVVLEFLAIVFFQQGPAGAAKLDTQPKESPQSLTSLFLRQQFEDLLL